MKKLLLSAALTLSLSGLAQADDQIRFTASDLPDVSQITLLTGGGALSDSAAVIDAQVGGDLSKAIKNAGFEGKFGKSIHFYNIGDFQRVTVIGTGDKALNVRELRDLGGHIAKASDKEDPISILAGDLETSVEAASAELAAGYRLGSYKFDKYKSEGPDADRVVTFYSQNADISQARYETDLEHLVDGIYFARDMGTEPGKSMYPERFAQSVRELFRGVDGAQVRVLGVREMTRHNMGALMGVGQGSVHDPRLVVVTYNGGAADTPPIALVGKGITFDTGGISLKPTSGQWQMKSDLSGAAAVAGTVYAAAKRGERINLVGVMAMAENMPADDAIRPGDVLETMSGKTIEVISTDAEGRLVLADAVRYAQDEFEPSFLIDIATLTGSAGSALGTDYAAIISRDWALSTAFMSIGKEVDEEVWPLPLNDNHFKAIKSEIADIKGSAGRPGASIGAAVIGTFVDEDQPWIHLDIAGVDWLESGRPTSPKGHAGWGVRFMDGVIRDRANKP